MEKDDSTRMFGVCLFFLGAGLFLGTQTQKTSMLYIALGVCGFGLFLIFLAKPMFKYLGSAFKEMSGSM